MIIGCLALGFLGAVFSSGWALLSGYGLWAAFGFYMFGGSLVMMATICAVLCTRPARHSDMVRA